MQEKQNTTGLIWFRNNLRTTDNVSLQKAINQNKKVIAVYFFDPKYFSVDFFGFKKTEKFRAQFLIETINNLKQNLAKLNITLLTYFDAPENKISALCDEFSVDAIYTQKEWITEEVDTNNAIKKNLKSDVKFIEDFDQFLYHPETVSKNFNNIPDVFTQFRKKLEKYVRIQESVNVTSLPETNKIENTTEIPSLKDLGFTDFEMHPKTAFPFLGGETEALKRLNYYLFDSKKVSFYKKTRNGLLGKDYSTKFSPWLANGSLSAKTIYHQVKNYQSEFGKNQSTYWVIFELIWRDYFKYISLKYDSKIFKIGGILDRNYQWNSDKKIIKNWINGETKDDFVNANMLELKNTGWE